LIFIYLICLRGVGGATSASFGLTLGFGSASAGSRAFSTPTGGVFGATQSGDVSAEAGKFGSTLRGFGAFDSTSTGLGGEFGGGLNGAALAGGGLGFSSTGEFACTSGFPTPATTGSFASRLGGGLSGGLVASVTDTPRLIRTSMCD
jgi:hypothetical protein